MSVFISVPGWCVRTLTRLAEELSDENVTFELLDAQRVQLELIFRELVAVEVYEGSGGVTSVVIDTVREVLSIIRNLAHLHEARRSDSQYQAPVTIDGTPGRPAFYIPRQQLAYLLENRFNCVQIADILGVSLRTVRRRMAEYNLTTHMFFTVISDQQLDEIVRKIRHTFPTCGNIQMQGHLGSRGIRVQQQRIREAQRRVDPSGSIMRRLRVIGRRHYHVNGPGALWHIDGNHKLIWLWPSIYTSAATTFLSVNTTQVSLVQVIVSPIHVSYYNS